MSEALGRALREAWGGGVKTSYKATGWYAQLRALTGHRQGSAAADAVGLDPSQTTVLRWLAESQVPSKANQDLIQRAYDVLAGRTWDPANETRDYRIHGEIDSGDRVEERTLLIDGSRGVWGRIIDAYMGGETSDEDLAALFVEDVIIEDIGDTTGEWQFPGSSYTV